MVIPYSWKFSRDLCFKNFVVQTKFVKYKTLKYFKGITLILSIAKKFVKIASLKLHPCSLKSLAFFCEILTTVKPYVIC